MPKTFADKDVILDLYYVRGNSTRDIESATGIGKSRVKRILRMHGTGARSFSEGSKLALTKRRQANQDRDAKICEMRTRGVPVQHIAKRVGVSCQTVHNVLRESGARKTPVECVANDNDVPAHVPAKGTAHYRAILDESKVTELRALRLANKREWTWHRLAKKGNAAPTTVRKAVVGDTWAHVTTEGGE